MHVNGTRMARWKTQDRNRRENTSKGIQKNQDSYTPSVPFGAVKCVRDRDDMEELNREAFCVLLRLRREFRSGRIGLTPCN